MIPSPAKSILVLFKQFGLTLALGSIVGSSNVLPPALTQALGGPARWSSLRPEELRPAPFGPITGTVALRKKTAPNTFWVRVNYDQEVEKLVTTS